MSLVGLRDSEREVRIPGAEWKEVMTDEKAGKVVGVGSNQIQLLTKT